MAVRPDFRFLSHQAGTPAGLVLRSLCAAAVLFGAVGCNAFTKHNPLAAAEMRKAAEELAEAERQAAGQSPRDPVAENEAVAKNEAVAENEAADGSDAAEERSPFRELPIERPDRRMAKRSAINPATEALIDAELATMPPDEQKQWREMFRAVDPAMIPQILEARRLKASDEPSGSPRRDAGVDDQPPAELAAADAKPLREEPIERQRAEFVRRRRQRESERLAAERREAPTIEQVAGEVPTGSTTGVTTADASEPAAVWPPNDAPSEPIAQAAFEREPARPVAPTDPTTRAVEQLISELEREIAAFPEAATEEQRTAQTKRRVFLRMLYLMNDQQARSLQAVPNVPAPHQEFWTQLFWGLTNYFDDESIPEPSHRASEAVAQLRAAARALQSEARLELRNAAFCNVIESFGNFVGYEKDEFFPGELVLVYLEPRNFSSELTTDGRYRTLLKSTIEIHRGGPNGGLVESEPLPAEEDVCGSVRNDFFYSYEVTLPSTLVRGPHTLKLIVEDELSHRVDTITLPFMVK